MNETAWIKELIGEIGSRISDKLEISSELVRPCGNSTIRRFSITQKFIVDAKPKVDRKWLIAKTRRYASKSSFAVAVQEPRTQRLAEQEYETHGRALDIFSQQDSMSVPVLFDLQKDLATIVMEAVPGKSLSSTVSSSHVMNIMHSKQSLRKRFYSAGFWLRTFHEGMPEKEHLRWKRESLDGLVADHLSTMRKDGLSQRKFDNVTAIFDRRLAEVDGRTTQLIGKIHGDFKPAHVIVDNQQLVVIDFGTTRTEYGAADVGNFLADLACNAYGPRLIRRATLDQLASVFLAGYNEPDGADSIDSLYCGANLLRLWRKRRQRFPNGTPLRKIDKAIDFSKSRGLINRAYVDRWFERTIASVLA